MQIYRMPHIPRPLHPGHHILFRLLLAALGFFSGAVSASTEEDQSHLRQIAQLAEYIGVDYVEAVEDGQIIDEGEYREMVEFSGLIVEKLGLLPGMDAQLTAKALGLQVAIQDKQDVPVIRTATAELRHALLALMPALSLPTQLIQAEMTAALFQAQCSSCHGATGHGDGPMAAPLVPAPTDFTDLERAENRSILGLFDAISNGIDETAMPAFSQLTEQERWSLAFHAGGLAFQSAREPGNSDEPAVSLQQIVNLSPAQLAADSPQTDGDDIAWLRANPGALFSKQTSPISITRERLLAAQNAHHEGNYERARNLAVSAYLDGFELVENSLDTRDEALRRSLEARLMQLRQALGSSQDDAGLAKLMDETLQQLDEADSLLSGSGLSGGTLFTASLVILLREGLEALLVVIALTTVLIRTQRKDALKYVHLGWIAALLAGAATWAAAQSLISISGANREIMEGFAALLAAVVLFYVGIWMHSKTHAAHWQAYIKKHIETRLQSGALWGLAALAFVAVYREVFETVLFYQTLLTQAVTSQYSFVAGGFVVGAIALVALAWMLIKYSVKLPLKTFFGTTTYLLLALSFVLMGKAVSALQEAAVIGMTPLPVSFEFNWIGVKSTWQGILAQASILIVFAVFVLRSRVGR